MILMIFVGAVVSLVTSSFQLHRMAPSDRVTDETIRHLPRGPELGRSGRPHDQQDDET
jgi:hypothetical protein